jgi:iron complex outermembrane receptor protein
MRPQTLLHPRALAALVLLPLAGLQGAAPATTVMSPFKVEAETGVDGVRIQPSAALLNPYLLEQHGIQQLQDLSGAAPNLFLSNSDTRGFGDIIALRGVTNSIFFSSPGVALYIDDVPSGSVSAYPSSLLNVDSLSVKAGPQIADFGRNAAGGVIEVRTREPGNRHQGKLQLDYGSFNYSSAQAAFEGPLSATTGYSVGLGLSDREGYLTNSLLKRTADDRRAVSARGALFWRPDAATRVRLAFRHETSSDDATRLSSLFSPDRRTTAANINGETSVERTQFSAQLRRRFAWGSLVATSARQEWKLDPSLTDLDLSPLSLGSSRVVQEEQLWTHEVRLESNAPATQARWRAGLYYSDQDTASDAQREFLVPPSQFVPPGFIQSERTRFDLGQRTWAAFAGWDQPLTAATLLRLGARLEDDATSIDRTKVSSNNFRFPTPPEPRLVRDQSETLVSASAGLQHRLSPTLNLVARTAVAHKPQGYSGFTANPALARFGQERQWAHEAGLTFGDQRSRFGGSVLAYWSVIRDYQFERTVPNSTDYVVVNAPEVLSRGLEAKAMWSPMERVWWDLQLGYAMTTFEDHRDARGAKVWDKQVPFVPRYTLRTGLTLDLGRGWSVNGSYQATGRTSYDERNTATFQQQAYGLVNAQLRYRVQGWTVAVYGHNLTDRQYDQFINPEIFAGSPGAPRRYGVQLTFEY